MKKVLVVGIGPGEYEQMTIRAASALREAQVIVGYTVYVDLVREHFPGKRFLCFIIPAREHCNGYVWHILSFLAINNRRKSVLSVNLYPESMYCSRFSGIPSQRPGNGQSYRNPLCWNHYRRLKESAYTGPRPLP